MKMKASFGTALILALAACAVVVSSFGAAAVADDGLYATAQPVKPSPDWIVALPAAQDPATRQLVVVAGMGLDKSTASVSMHERGEDGKWRQLLSTPGYVGLNGMCPADKRVEGNKKTPIGVFRVGKAFGIEDDPGCPIPYVKVTDDLYWSGDHKKGMRYNELVSIKDYPTLDTGNSEHLIEYEYPYRYCLDIGFNADCVVGRGSAIFFHCLGDARPYTSGCVAIPENKMKLVMQKIQEGCVFVVDTLENLGGSI